MENYPVINNEQNLRFETNPGDEPAFLEYRWHQGAMALMHTFVPEKYSGKGIAATLAKTALEYAKEKDIKIIVYCPYVAAYLKKHPEYEGLISKK